MTVRKTVKLEIYECEVVFIITDQLAQEAYKIQKKTNRNASVSDSEGCAGLVTYADMDRYYVLFDSAYLGYNLIGHELHHLVTIIGEHRDIYDDEALAWLAGKMHETFMKFFKSKENAIYGSLRGDAAADN